MFTHFYGMREQPFGVTPDPRFTYLTPAHREAFASLLYGIEAGRGFMALVAPPGLGKTCLLFQLMNRLRESALTAFLFQTQVNLLGFLRNVLLDLDIEPAGYDLSDLQKQLIDVLIGQTPSGKRFVLVIDEAQNLDASLLESIRILSNFETPRSKLMQIVIAGQPELADKLLSPQLRQLRQRISILAHLPPLGTAEVGKYVDHRLRIAGYSGDRLFTAEALALIARESHGVPRNINNLCFHALSLGYANGRKRIDRSCLREVLADLNLERLKSERTLKTAANPSNPGCAGPHAADSASARVLENVRITPGHSTVSGAETEAESVLHDRDRGDGQVVVSGGGNRRLRIAAAVALVALLCGILWSSSSARSKLAPIGHFVVSASSDARQKVLAEVGAGSRQTGPLLDSVDAVKKPGDHALDLPVKGVASPHAGNADSIQAEMTDRQSATQGNDGLSKRPQGSSAMRNSSGRISTAVMSAHRPLRTSKVASRAGTAALEPIAKSGAKGTAMNVNDRRSSRRARPRPRTFSPVRSTYDVSDTEEAHPASAGRQPVASTQKQWVVANLRQADKGGVFSVRTDPPGLQVAIDGSSYGPSPVRTTLDVGRHTYVVTGPPGRSAFVGQFKLDYGAILGKSVTWKSQEGSQQEASRSRSGGETIKARH